MKSNLLLTVVWSVFFISCEYDKTLEVPPVTLSANFTTIDTLYAQHELVEFQYDGDSAVNYYWEFGDGNSSKERCPKHLYSSPGTYNVKLKICNEYNDSDSITKQIRIGEWFVYQIELIHLDEYKYYKKEESWDEDSTGLNALPDICFEIKGTKGEVYYVSETYYNLPSNKLPLKFDIPNVKIDPWFINIDKATIHTNLNEIDGDEVENIMTTFDYGSITFKYDNVAHMGEFTINAGATFRVLYIVK